MIDIHSHIIPRVDDGANSAEVAARMMARYAAQGVEGVVCTPHQNRNGQRPEALRAAFEALQRQMAGSPVRLYLGAEIYYYEDMLRDLKAGRLLTMNGTAYVLVEFSVKYNVADIPEAVYELRAAGYLPIVAHMERYGYLSEEDCYGVKESGGLVQVNAGALLAGANRRRARFLLKHGLADFVASDCHDDGGRCVNLQPAERLVRRKFTAQYDKLFCNGHFGAMLGQS